jgi:hypothetical protein
VFLLDPDQLAKAIAYELIREEEELLQSMRI